MNIYNMQILYYIQIKDKLNIMVIIMILLILNIVMNLILIIKRINIIK